MPDAATVRVLNDVNSTVAGKTLRVVRTKIERGGKTSYLCEMPGYAHPGWFHESEVEHVAE